MTRSFECSSGPHPAKIVLVGEAWGQSEAIARRPFVGSSGQLLWQMLGEAFPVEIELHAKASAMMRYGEAWIGSRDAWLEATGVLLTNVLNLQPPGNNMEALCVSKSEVPSWYKLQPVSRGKYLQPDYLSEVRRLRDEINQASPNIVVALGNTACWAILQATNIGSIRGTVVAACLSKDDGKYDHAGLAGVAGDVPYSPPLFLSGQEEIVKVLPTYHPAAVLRQWSWRPIVVADLMKAWRESSSPEIRRQDRSLVINPTLGEIARWTRETLSYEPRMLSIDIETVRGQIKSIAFARAPGDVLIIPFLDESRGFVSFWSTHDMEYQAWTHVKALLECPVLKLFQNGLYDLQYLMRMGFKPANCRHDTMLRHHAQFPEMQKGLGFLGSIYTDESAWKLLRMKKADTEKRDE